jgi:hypothetical protein
MTPRDNARIDRYVRWFNRCVWAAAAWAAFYLAYSLATDEPRPVHPTTSRNLTMNGLPAPTAEHSITYTTSSELEFLGVLAAKPQAKVLLRNYLRSASSRVAWGDIDKASVVLRAESLLADAEARS